MSDPVPPITPPATLGILGGGQLGRYFVAAARTMGYRTIVLEPDPLAPAGAIADEHLVAAYDEPDALARLGRDCAVVTTEFENPPAHALASLAALTRVHPSPETIAVAQDRRTEKRFLAGAGLPTAPFAVVERATDLAGHGITWPAILKTARLGYDGKGQLAVSSDADLGAAWQSLGSVPCVLEQRLALDREVSVVLARSATGQVAIYSATANVHVDGILDVSVAPLDAPGAAELAARVAAELDYVGVLGVELFVVGGELIVNEVAPRPHNSGHWTLDAARTSQFEQQVRAVCGLALGDTTMSAGGVAMVNLLGELWAGGEPDWAAALADPGAHLHLYGKREPRAGRKMGHLTVVAATPDDAARRAVACRDHARRGLQLDH